MKLLKAGRKKIIGASILRAVRRMRAGFSPEKYIARAVGRMLKETHNGATKERAEQIAEREATGYAMDFVGLRAVGSDAQKRRQLTAIMEERTIRLQYLHNRNREGEGIIRRKIKDKLTQKNIDESTKEQAGRALPKWYDFAVFFERQQAMARGIKKKFAKALKQNAGK